MVPPSSCLLTAEVGLLTIASRLALWLHTQKDLGDHVIALLLGTSFFSVWTAIDWRLYQSFSFHIWDLGATFSLTYGNAPQSLDYGHLAFAPQSLIYIFFIPIVKAFPSPFALVIAQNAVLAVGGAFVYLVTRQMLRRPKLGLLFEALYLFSYDLFGAPYFPIHYEVLFASFFLIAFYFVRVGNRLLGAFFLVLAGLCSTLAAVTVPIFIAVELWPDFRLAIVPRFSGISRFVRQNAGLLLAGLIVVSSALFAILYAGLDVVLSYGKFASTGVSSGVAGGATQDLQLKLTYIALVLVPFALALFRSWYSILLLPYLALVLVSASTHYALFSYPYTAIIGTTLFVTLVDSLKDGHPTPRRQAVPPPKLSLLAQGTRSPNWGRASVIWVTVAIVSLSAVIVPLSPLNALAGLQNSQSPFYDYELQSQTSVSSYDQALARMGSMMPMGSSVLIQENMPQFTNRALWFEPGSYFGSPLVDYVLTDPASNYFTEPPPSFIGGNNTTMEEWFNALTATGAYGVKAEYEGAVLLEKGYRGLPVFFRGFSEFIGASEFTGGTYTENPSLGQFRIVNNETSGHDAFHSANGLLSLPPGTYTINFTLGSSSFTSNSSARVGLSSTLTGGSVAFSNITGADFVPGQLWHNFTVTFTSLKYVSGLYLQVNYTFWYGALRLQSASITQGPV